MIHSACSKKCFTWKVRTDGWNVWKQWSLPTMTVGPTSGSGWDKILWPTFQAFLKSLEPPGHKQIFSYYLYIPVMEVSLNETLRRSRRFGRYRMLWLQFWGFGGQISVFVHGMIMTPIGGAHDRTGHTRGCRELPDEPGHALLNGRHGDHDIYIGYQKSLEQSLSGSMPFCSGGLKNHFFAFFSLNLNPKQGAVGPVTRLIRKNVFSWRQNMM